MCTSVPPRDWQLFQWNTGLQALPEGIKPPLILIQFGGARLQTCAFIEKDKSFGIDILQGALGECRWAVLDFGGGGIDGVFWHGNTLTHTHTHSSVNSSPCPADGGPCAEDETQHSNPAVPCKATALLKALLHMSAATTCSRNWDGRELRVVVMVVVVWGWRCFVLLSRGRSICCFHCEQEQSDVIQVPFP